MFKKILPWSVFIVLIVLLVAGYSLKGTMNSYLSKMMKDQVSPGQSLSSEMLIDSLYNYSENGLDYRITFLEFGAKNCSACKQMEGVMEEIRNKNGNRINVVFLNILLPENQNLMKYYGIATIPTQVLLDKNGKEYFRHNGFLSYANILRHLK